jgi:cytochrome c peroxidase
VTAPTSAAQILRQQSQRWAVAEAIFLKDRGISLVSYVMTERMLCWIEEPTFPRHQEITMPDSNRRECLPGAALLAACIFAWLAPLAFAQPAPEDAKLLKDAKENLQPLPKDAATREFPVSPDRVRLGRMLFFDPRISVDGTGSCLHCHQPALYGADALPKSRGVRDQQAPRNAPTVLNSALQVSIHWDGMFENVEVQAGKALLGPGFGNSSHAVAMDRLKAIPGYRDLFRKTFPDDAEPMTPENWGKAIGAYERTLVTPSRFDEFLGGKTDSLSAVERRGLRTFIDVGCIECHNGAGVGGHAYKKFGVADDYWKATRSPEVDKGRFNITKDETDLYVFKVPTLRNVAMTAPYFHDGSVKTLAEAVRVMGTVQLGTDLSDEDTNSIVAFLGSLTGPLPETFAVAPVLPPGSFTPLPEESAVPRKK